MPAIYIQYFKTPYGELLLGSLNDALCLCDWRFRKLRAAIDERLHRHAGAAYLEADTLVLQAARQQLLQYFARERTEFTLPLRFLGTDFQKRVWTELTHVPYGQTATYLALAQRLGQPTAVRAVASANGANALSLFVPCHRILGSDRSLVGYAGGLKAKEKLLQLETPPPQLPLQL